MSFEKEKKRNKNFLSFGTKRNSKEELDGIIDYKNLGITGVAINKIDIKNRKSSAEIVSEARSMLAGGGGARLVSTRRPVTPRDPRRQLYGGKLAPAGRPPSSFSLRYLQFENGRALPPLEPIYQQSSPPSEPNESYDDNILYHFRRSGSVGTLLDKEDRYLMINDGLSCKNQKNIPSLLTPLNVTTDEFQNEHDLQNTMELQHPLWQRQTRSFDMPLKPSEQIAVLNAKKEYIGDELDHSSKINETLLERKKDKISDEINKNSNDSGDGNDPNIQIDNNFERNNILINSCPSSRARLLTRSNLLSQSTTETLLEMLKAHAGIKECSDETVQHIYAILVEVYARVKETSKGDWRGAILGGLYGLVECSSPKILLAVARVVLALSVTGSNLTGACKLVFKVARNEMNDYLFFESDVPELLIDGLGRASPLDDPEACIYGYGAVRFLFNASLNMSQQSSATSNNNNNNGRLSARNNKTSASSNDQIINKKQKKSLAIRLSKAGAVQLMVLHLQILNEAGAEKSLVGQPLHALYQLSAALRALAGIPHIILENDMMEPNSSMFDSRNNEKRNSKSFEFLEGFGNSLDKNEANLIDNNSISMMEDQQQQTKFTTKEMKNINLELACPHLVKAAEISLGESEIQINIIRTLSVLSDHDDCCMVLADYVGRIGMLLGPSHLRQINAVESEKSLGLLSRLGYILGNIMARFDSSRLQFYHNDVAMEYLLNNLDVYSRQSILPQNQSGDTVVEVLIKLIRVIANMSVNADVGYGIGSKPLLGQVLLRMLMKINKMMPEELNDEIDELLQAILGAMHNLCFYQDRNFIDNDDNTSKVDFEPSSGHELTSMNELIPELSIELSNTLKKGSNQIKAEVSRVLGNMTRNALARDAFCTAGGLKDVVQCLKSEDYDLKSTCSGVLVNLLGDWERRIPFYEMCGPLILNDILEKSANESDWLLAGIVCQAIWNYLIDSCNVINALGEAETDKISAQLVEYLDEEKLFRGEPPDIIWEQFASVATDLLERIQSSLEQGNETLAHSD